MCNELNTDEDVPFFGVEGSMENVAGCLHLNSHPYLDILTQSPSYHCCLHCATCLLHPEPSASIHSILHSVLDSACRVVDNVSWRYTNFSWWLCWKGVVCEMMDRGSVSA